MCRAPFGQDLIGVNFVRDALVNPAASEGIVNWPEVAWAGLDRLRRQHRLTPFDAELAQLVSLAETALAGVPRPEQTGEPLVCPWFRVGERVVRSARSFLTRLADMLDDATTFLLRRYAASATAALAAVTNGTSGGKRRVG